MMIVFTTVPDSSHARDLAEAVVAAKLAACVQILPPMMSVYVWEGKVQKETEILLLIKTLPEKYDELERFVTEHHTYDVPEIIGVDAVKISRPYREWMHQVTGSELR